LKRRDTSRPGRRRTGKGAGEYTRSTESGEKLIDESEREFEFYMNAFISSLLEAKEDIKQDHITTLLTEKGKEITKCFEPHRRYRVLRRLKAFVDSEAVRIDKELESLKEFAN